MKTFVELPLLPLRDVVVYSHMVTLLFTGRERSIEALEAVMTGDEQVLLLAQKNSAGGNPSEDGLYHMGTVVTVLQLLKLPDGIVRVLAEGGQRGQVEHFIEEEGHICVAVQAIDDTNVDKRKAEVFARGLLSQFKQHAQLGKKVPARVLSSLNNVDGPSRLVDTIAARMALKTEQKQGIPEIIDLSSRIEHALAPLGAEIDLLQMEKRICGRARKQMEHGQRKYYLNEQTKAIQKKLGDIDEGHNGVEEPRKRIDAAGLTEEAHTKATAELNKLKQMSPMSAGATVMHSYIDWLLDVSWKAEGKVHHDLAKTEGTLDADHYDLERIEEHVFGYLTAQKRVEKLKDPALYLVGPPGMGETSPAESIARATSRKFACVTLGGVYDETEIRDHRRIYIGSVPGRLIQKMTKVGMCNPLFLLDRIDKMGSDMRKDPASALLEVLDPEQSHNLNGHYLEVDYDLSDVMFLCTTNSMNIPTPLLDRMEVIHLPGYTEDEEADIASKYLVPKQVQANGLKRGELILGEGALCDIIHYYTRRTGVRSLERQITKVCRKVVKEHAKFKRIQAVVSGETLESYFGVHKFRYGFAEQQGQIGQVIGPARIQVGGKLLTIEAAVVSDKGQLTGTGSLDDVMAESIIAALTAVRNHAQSLGIAADFRERRDTHTHVPEDVTPKDGPSVGIGMCAALISAITQTPVHANVATIGEITLCGQVLAIGGLKEELLAAYCGGTKTMIIPEENVRDLKEIPDNIKNDPAIKPVKWIDEVLQIALQYVPEPLPDAVPGMVAKDEKHEPGSRE